MTKPLLLQAFVDGIEANPYDTPDYDNIEMNKHFLAGQLHREEHIPTNSPPRNERRKDIIDGRVLRRRRV